MGFPGETEEDFQQLLDFLTVAQLDRVAASNILPSQAHKPSQLPDPIPESIQQERYERFMACQAEISQAKLQNKIGQEITVLIDQVDEEGAIARSAADAPEIDGLVYIEDGQNLEVGSFAKVQVIEADEYDLYAIKTIRDEGGA